MPTNDERRQVAKRLRVLASHAPADAEMVLDALDLYEGEYIEGFDPRCVQRLADFIEPEPERTCRNINPVSCRNFICSKCDDSYEKGAGNPNPNFCPNCGAKVVR